MSIRGPEEWPLSAVPEIARLQREVGAGRCPFCERQLPPYKGNGRRRVICYRADCATEYERAYALSRYRFAV